MKTVIAICENWLCPYYNPQNSMISTIEDDIKELRCLNNHNMKFKEL